MFCYIYRISLAFLFTFDFIRANSIEISEEPRRPLKIDLNALKNAAEVVKVLKALNKDDDPQTSQEKEGYGKQEEKVLKGIDMDYLGIDGERNENIQELLELMQKNKDAKENHDLTRTELTPRLYFISNPEVLEKYREMIKQGNESDSTSSSDLDESNEESSGMKSVWELLNTMRRDGDADRKGPSKKMIHPRLLHLTLEHDVPSIRANIIDKHEAKNEKVEKKKSDVQYLRVIKHEGKDDDGKLDDASDNLETTKIPFSSLENTEHSAKDAIRTTYKFHVRDDANDKSAPKKYSLENRSVDNDKPITKIDFKANSREGQIDDNSLESYKPPKKARKTKESNFDDDNNNFVNKNMETHKSPKKETKNYNNDSADYGRKKPKRWEKQEEQSTRWGKPEDNRNRWDKPENKGNRWGKPENKGNRWDKPENKGNRWDKPENKGNRWDTPENKGNRWDKPDRFEEKKFTTQRKESNNEERNYNMNRPRINPQIDRPGRNIMSNPRENNAPNTLFKAFGRTPVPVVGNRGIYEDD